MLSEEQIGEIREHLEKAQNPVFFYDNDADGLCSYVLLRRFIGRGKGVAVRSHPDLDVSYVRKTQELNADYVFVLDVPNLGEDFVKEIKSLGIPIVWVDHHDIEDQNYDYDDLFVYNAAKSGEKKSWPVTYWSYKVANRKEDIWFGLMGCIADHHLPDFVEDFVERYPELWKQGVERPFDAVFGTEIGRLSKALNFGLKDSISHVVQFQNFLIECRNPQEMVEALEGNKPFGRKYREIRDKYDALIKKARECVDGDLVFFVYGGDLSISSEISNELSHMFQDKYIVVAYKIGAISNLSIRGDDVKGILERLLEKFEHAKGGGHRDAVGARLNAEDLDKFREEFVKEITK